MELTQSPIPILNGFKVFKNNMACVSTHWKQFRLPKSKKVRIRKKWRKNIFNFKTVEVHKVINIGDKIYLSERDYDRFINSPEFTNINN